MEARRPLDLGSQYSSYEEQIRALGFDPDHLTPEEQEELLELHLTWPDEALSA